MDEAYQSSTEPSFKNNSQLSKSAKMCLTDINANISMITWHCWADGFLDMMKRT